ncbi:Cro/CI family transcriptional regulator [Pseudomonas syringae pv. spinaceae]|uniref:Cro/CI family transcriptional regulator n=1 Tax=Pseudomonas syringae pv. spinaceae TaxID=264459 RepID=A0A0Q0DF94_PSESX|nr:helix-turn-helix domain-containing protein [Pseudomonas syringae]KPY96083.1 Cro/CI family transcriptional regulator [Pseudomonas syringae pv. spinaceae]
MSLKLALAAVLRTLRRRGRLSQESLNYGSSRTYMFRLEKGASTVTLDKLESICAGLEISPLTFLALTLSAKSGDSTQMLLQRVQAELDEFEHSGGSEVLKAEVAAGAVVERRPGKPVDPEKLKKVLQCKAEGMSQKMASEMLGIPKQTVHDLWRRDVE